MKDKKIGRKSFVTYLITSHPHNCQKFHFYDHLAMRIHYNPRLCEIDGSLDAASV